MVPIQRNEILPLGEYELIRERFRSRVIAEKRARRVSIGEHLSAVFESRDTVMLQIQEMLRTERITKEPAILHEIETYNELLPTDGGLSLTLFVEIPSRELRDQMLVDLAGLEDHVRVEIDGERFPASGKREGAEASRTTAVHYLKVALSPEASAKIRERKVSSAAVVVDHPKYSERAELSRATLSSLADDAS